MKVFVAVTLVALVALAQGRAIRDLKSDLIAKGNRLVSEANAAIVKLEAEKKVQEVAIVRVEEAQLKRLVAELELAAGPAVSRIEGELSQAEQKLQFELAKVNRSPVLPNPIRPIEERDLKSDLIAKGQKLITDANAAIVKLEADKKVQEVAIVRVEEAQIKRLIAELELASNPLVVSRIEGELSRAEQKLAFEIQKVNRGTPVVGPVVDPIKVPVERDLKSDLIAKGQKLITDANAAIVKLEADKKVQEVTIVRVEEAQIKRLIAELELASSSLVVSRLEGELSRAEQKLQFELAKVNRVVPVPGEPRILPGGPVVA